MRFVLRVLGLLSVLVAFASAGLVAVGLAQGRAAMMRLGRLWYETDAASLNALQAGIERHLWPPLWSGVVFPVLDRPAPVVAGVALVLGMVLLLVARRRNGGRRRRLFDR